MDIDVKDGRLVRWIKLISSLVLFVAAFFVISFALTVVRDSPDIESKSSPSSLTHSNGLESEYRYDCDQFKCTPLDDYVWRNNDAYEYEEIVNYGSLTGRRQVKTYILNMTSQHWLTEDDVDRTLWYHDIILSLPRTIHPSHSKSCLVYIDDGWNNPNGDPFPEDNIIVKGSQQLALSTSSCVAIIAHIPNQKLYFKNDPRMGEKGRDEDDLIAWTWKHFMLYPNQPDWLLRLPMTKAVRLAFDTIDNKIQALKNTPTGRDWKDQFGDVIDEFTVAGASKRGWTTWTIAAVDKRVKAITPMVLDCLNMKKNFADWWKNMGGWSFALVQYYNEGLTAYFDAPEFEKMAEIIDPLAYKDRLKMPKLVISATGDEFFHPDDSYNWFDQMKGKTYLRLLPNAEHGMIPPQALSSPSIIHSIRGFYMAVQRNYNLPNLKWDRNVDSNGRSSIILTSDEQPILINAWTADTMNTTRRDWRWAKLKTESVNWPSNSPEDQKHDLSKKDIELQPIKWNQFSVESLNSTAWEVSINPAANVYRAIFIEVSYQGSDEKSKLTFTTEISITPDTRPFPQCQGEGCFGYLL